MGRPDSHGRWRFNCGEDGRHADHRQPRGRDPRSILDLLASPSTLHGARPTPTASSSRAPRFGAGLLVPFISFGDLADEEAEQLDLAGAVALHLGGAVGQHDARWRPGSGPRRRPGAAAPWRRRWRAACAASLDHLEQHVLRRPSFRQLARSRRWPAARPRRRAWPPASASV